MIFAGELISSVPYVALGNSVGEEVIAARKDGEIARVNAGSLTEEGIARVPGEPVWVHAEHASDGSSWSLIAILKRPEWVQVGDDRRQVDRYSIYDAATESNWDLPTEVDAAHMDRFGRLWLGADHGEFVGWIVAAYVGVVLLGLALQQFVVYAAPLFTAFDGTRFTRTPADLSSLEQVHDIRVRDFFGRPDAVGAYPAIIDAIQLDDAGGLVFTTRRDGVVSLKGTKERRHAVGGQLEATKIVEIGAAEDATVHRRKCL